MNGIAILHLESGMMMYQNQFKKNFGIQNCDGNALQLTSKLFALYQASRSSAKSPAGCSQDRVGLQWFQLVSTSE